MYAKLLRYFLTLSFILQFFILHAQPETQTSSQKTFQKLDEYLVSAANIFKFNGTALVAEKGKILLQKGYGYKSFSNNSLNNSNSIYEIGSLTKPFTAAIIVKLQEEGELSIHDKLNKYFPSLKNGEKITIENLLTHTSGLKNYTDIIGPEDSAIITNPVPKERILDIFQNKPLEFKPGTKFSYCNSGYFLLGMIIEKVTGTKYEQVVRNRIFDPLNMKNSGFDFKNLKDTAKTQGYSVLNKYNKIESISVDSTVYYSAGAMYSTTGDLYNWAKAIAEKKLLTEDSWKQIFTPFKNSYGYGWYIDSLIGKSCIRHEGGFLGFMSDFYYYPQEDVSIILLTNEGNYGESLLPIIMGLSAIVFNLPYHNWVAQTGEKADEATLQQYVGVYTTDGKVKIYVTVKDGQLYAEGNSKQSIPKLPIYPQGPDKFLLKDFNVIFEFIKNADGKVLGFISPENGKNVEFKKIK